MIEPEDGAGLPSAEDLVLAQAGADPELLDAMTPAEEGVSSRSRRSLQGRIDELTRGRREAEREAEYWREIALEATASLEARAEAADDRGPNPEDYVHGEEDADFIRDRAHFEAAQDYQRQAEEFARAHEEHRHNEAFTARARAAADRLPDFEALVIEGSRNDAWPCSPEMAQAIKTSEVGPELAYALACNPDEAHRIAALPHASQIREIGRLEGRLLHHAEAGALPERKTATTAPEPPPTLRGSGSRFAIAPDTNDFAAFDKQYG